MLHSQRSLTLLCFSAQCRGMLLDKLALVSVSVHYNGLDPVLDIPVPGVGSMSPLSLYTR